MKTEKATNRYDLPHAVELAAGICVCGRPDDHAIHHDLILERASHNAGRPQIITEKGT